MKRDGFCCPVSTFLLTFRKKYCTLFASHKDFYVSMRKEDAK